MPTSEVVIDDIVCGDTRHILFTVDALPVGQRVVEAKLTVRETLTERVGELDWEDDSDALISKFITPDVDQPGEGFITDDGSQTQTVEGRFELTHEDTKQLERKLLLKPALRWCYFDIQFKTNLGMINTPFHSCKMRGRTQQTRST